MHFIRLCTFVFLLSCVSVAHAGTDLGYYHVTRYYTPVEGQERYYNGWKANYGQCATKNLYYVPYMGKTKGDFRAEACMNGQGDIFTTADGTDLRTQKAATVAACPPKFLGRTLHIQNVGYVKCIDTGGAIHGKRIDLWAGIGDEGYHAIPKLPGGSLHIHLKDHEKDSTVAACVHHSGC